MDAVRLYVDEDAGEHAVVQGLRARAIDVLTTIEAGQVGATDASQLSFASVEKRAIYTFNVRDFAQLHREYLATNQQHAGIIVIPDQRCSVGEKIRRLARFIHCVSAVDVMNRMEYL